MTLEQLFEGSDLSQDFKDKVQGMLDEAINEEKQKQDSLVEARVAEKVQEIEETYTQYGEQYGEYIKEEMEEKMDNYLKEEVIPTISKYIDNVADRYLSENKLQVESGLKVELAEKFFGSILEAAEAFNVDIPENTSLVESMEEKLEKANKTVDELVTEKEQLASELVEMKKADIVDEVSAKADLTESQKERFQVACEGVKFVDQDQYTSTIEELVESYNGSSKKINEDKEEEQKDTITEDNAEDWYSKLFAKL